MLTQVNETLDVVIWPATVIIGLLLFRTNIQRLIDRFNRFGGKLGEFSFEVSLQQYAEQTAGRISALETEGKNSEAKAVLANASSFIMNAYGLTASDVEYLVRLADGAAPARRWGKISLVRSGLIELDGGHLTQYGRQLVDGLLSKVATEA